MVILLVASYYRETFLLMITFIRVHLQAVDDELSTLSRLFYDINLNRSNSDCTTRKTDGSPFVRMSVERTSMRRKKVILIRDDLNKLQLEICKSLNSKSAGTARRLVLQHELGLTFQVHCWAPISNVLKS